MLRRMNNSEVFSARPLQLAEATIMSKVFRRGKILNKFTCCCRWKHFPDCLDRQLSWMRRVCRLSGNVLCCIVFSNAVQLHFLELRPLIMDQRLPRLDNGYPKQQFWPMLKRHLDYASIFCVPRISWKVEHLGKVTRRRG